MERGLECRCRMSGRLHDVAYPFLRTFAMRWQASGRTYFCGLSPVSLPCQENGMAKVREEGGGNQARECWTVEIAPKRTPGVPVSAHRRKLVGCCEFALRTRFCVAPIRQQDVRLLEPGSGLVTKGRCIGRMRTRFCGHIRPGSDVESRLVMAKEGLCVPVSAHAGAADFAVRHRRPRRAKPTRTQFCEHRDVARDRETTLLPARKRTRFCGAVSTFPGGSGGMGGGGKGGLPFAALVAFGTRQEARAVPCYRW